VNVTVKLFAFFRDNRFKAQDFVFEEGTTVQQVIEHFNIPVDEVGVTMINGRHCQLETTLAENDNLSIFPMIGGG
jgi:molybdopterin converting factor small subunit